MSRTTCWRAPTAHTHGFKFGGGAPFELLQLPATELLEQMGPKGGGAIHLGLFIGQNLYTPKSINNSQPQPFDRPWAAWLYLGGVAQRAMENRLDTVEIDLGLVGPSALGREIQSGWHRLIAHNIFLDGTVFRDSPSVRRRPHVYNLTAGISLRIEAVRLSLTRVRLSEEFFGIAGNDGSQIFDSINPGIEF